MAQTVTPTPKVTSSPSTVPTQIPLLGITPTPAPAKTPTKIATVTAEAYRATLQSQLKQLKALENHIPRRLGPLLNKFDVSVIVKRADGQTQQVNGNSLSALNRDVTNGGNAKRNEVIAAGKIVENQLKALDEWLVKPAYTSSPDAKNIIDNLEASGQIRTGPLWWQVAISEILKSIGRTWKNFIDWLNGLLPKTSSITPKYVPSGSWLWPMFYCVVAAILIAILWFIWRAFGGKWGRRTVKRDTVLQSEDAQLLLLPPEELLSRAEVYATQGNFREALRHRYLALLLHLDGRGIWRYDTRRTNWEHIAALSRRGNMEPLVEPLSGLTRRFDRVRYGGAPCDEAQWRQYDADTRQLESQINSLERTAVVAR